MLTNRARINLAPAFVPLLAPIDDTRRQLVGLLVLRDCELAPDLSGLDLTQLAGELSDEDGATEVA